MYLYVSFSGLFLSGGSGERVWIDGLLLVEKRRSKKHFAIPDFKYAIYFYSVRLLN